MRLQPSKLAGSVLAIVTLFGPFTEALTAQGPVSVPPQYRRLFTRYLDTRSLPEKALNLAGLTSQDVGRSFALIAGVTRYPRMKPPDNELIPAAEDLRKLAAYLTEQEFFDEVVVLKDGDVTFDNLAYFLQTYFPDRLRQAPKSRFLFAYTGHGIAEGRGPTGYLLTAAATSKTDKQNALNLNVIRTLLDHEIEFGYNVLVLLNACHSGAFLRRSFGGAPYLPRHPGAHAITAGGARELSWSDPSVGTGSVFFEKLFAGLGGQADTSPRGGDGLITVDELTTYLKQEVRIATDQNQNPLAGDLSANGSLGGFFFLNRGRQIAKGVTKDWNPQNLRTFGSSPGDTLHEAGALVSKATAVDWWTKAASAGQPDAMASLGTHYARELNDELARQWFEKGSAAGNAQAMSGLARLLEKENGTALDFAAARHWWEKAAAAGDPTAKDHLAELRAGEANRRQNETAAAAGDVKAMVSLGHSHRNGQGFPVDLPLACQWYAKAADLGNVDGMTLLGYCYKNGSGVTQDYAQARTWLQKAASAAEPSVSAMYFLGMLYRDGKGGDQDFDKAIHWLQKAAIAGDEDAPRELAKLRKILNK